MNRIPVCSFFSGAGFLDLGFYLAEYDIIFTNEISDGISSVYESGMSTCLNKEVKITSNASIELISAEQIKSFVKQQQKDKFWGIIGGPPSPDFSIGERKQKILK